MNNIPFLRHSSSSCRLKTVSLVVKNSQTAEALVHVYESKLYEEDALNCDLKSIETVISTLKVDHLPNWISICFLQTRQH